MNTKVSIKNNRGFGIAVIIALLHWVISFFTDTIIFNYVKWDTSSMTGVVKMMITYGCKLAFLLLLIGLYCGLYAIIKSYKRNRKVRKWVQFSAFYLLLMLLLLLLTWPGIWRMDEFGILKSARELYPLFWQNYLTSAFYIMGMMLVPIPAGVIILQIILIAAIVGFLLTMADTWSNHSKWTYLMYIPFLMLPVLDSNLYPMRMSVYAFLELLWVAVLYDMAISKQTITKKRILLTALLGAVITVWRTEAIYYVIAAPIIVIVLLYKKLGRKQIKQFILSFLLFTLILGIPQQVGNKMTSGDQYEITSLILPITPLVEQAHVNGDTTELSAIDKVLNTELLLQGYEAGDTGIQIFWSHSDLVRTGYTGSDYKQFKKAYNRLISKYPSVFLKERVETFANSNNLLSNTTEIFTADWSPNYPYFRENYKANIPVSNEMRSAVIKFIECRNQDDYESLNSFYPVFYNFLLPLAFLFVLFLVLLAKRKWGYALLLGGVGAKVPLIFLTAPSRLFMYYYSIYVIGYAVFFFGILKFLTKTNLGKRLTGNNIHKTIDFLKKNGLKEVSVKVRERLQRDRQESGYNEWLKMHLPSEEELEQQRKTVFAIKPLISILVPAYQTKEIFLRQLIESIQKQTYSHFELCIADGSRDDSVEKIVTSYQDERIRYERLLENKGISENTNEAMKMATGEYITLVDHDDIITENALYEIVKAIVENPDADMLYSDEDKVSWNLDRYFTPHFKTDFNLDLLRSNNYICHLFVVKKEIALQVEGFNSEFNGAQDYDFILRCSENAKCIVHVPKILYHWRSHIDSTAENPASKLYAYEAGRKALEAHLTRKGLKASVLDTVNYGYYYIKYTFTKNMNTNTKHFFDTIVQVWDCKQPIRETADYLFIQDNTIAEISNNFLEEMLGICQREEVGVVGGMITDSHRKIVFGGGFYKNDRELMGYPFRGMSEGFKGYMNRLMQVQDCSFVSSKFCLIKKSAFLEVNGFTNGLTGDFAMLDLCFKLSERGYLTVYTPYAKAVLKKGVKSELIVDKDNQKDMIRNKWNKQIEKTDGYYNANLSVRDNQYFTWTEGME